MSACRSFNKTPAPLKTLDAAKKGGSRLGHVLSIGLSNMRITNEALMPATCKEPPLARAGTTLIVNVGIPALRKTLSVVPEADIGVNWDNKWAPGQEDEKVQKWNDRIAHVKSIYPPNGKRARVYNLSVVIESLGNPDGLARSGSVNRGYYVYLLQLFEQALRSAQVQGSNDRHFSRDWAVIVKNVDIDTTNLAFKELGDPSISNDVKTDIIKYFDFVNKYVYNFFTDGNIMATPSLANKTSPKLTAYLMSLVNPPDDVLEGSNILRDMSLAQRGEALVS